MSLETTLAGWTGPSSATEQEKQDRTKRMIQEAVGGHDAFEDCSLSVYAKGSYANNTNVKVDSDVDIAVQCHDVEYYSVAEGATKPPGTPYTGIWTPEKLRSELVAALRAKFPGQIDTSGSIAIGVNSSSARVDADVVPCFDYRFYRKSDSVKGTRMFSTAGSSRENYPDLHLENGKTKNTATNTRFKRAVRIMKRVENEMVATGKHREVPSYFIECLVCNCPNTYLTRTTWTGVVRGVLGHVWEELQGDEPSEEADRWEEVDGIKFLFHPAQKWTRADGRDFAKAAWDYLDL